MITKFTLGIAIGGTLLIFSGCSRTPIEPTIPFLQVQENVALRTGEIISWEESGVIWNCLEDLLQEEVDVDKAVQISLLNNPKLKATYENLGIAQAQLVQAGLFENPIFNLSLRYENLVHAASIIEMGLLQNFLDILLKPLKTKLASIELEITKSEVSGAVMDVIANIKIAYYTLQAAEQTFAMKKQFLDTAEASYDVAKRLYDVGNITDLALSIQRVQYEQAKIDLSTSEIEVIEAKEKLNVLMGLWGGQTHWKIASEFDEIPKEEISLEYLENCVIANSLDLKMAWDKLCATATRLGIETNELVIPEIGLGPDSEKEPEGTWFIGPQLSIAVPIFDFGKAKLASGKAELSQLWNEYIALAIQIRSAARSWGCRLLNAHKQSCYSQKVLIPLAEKITTETLHQLNAMQLGVFDLLLAKQREIETKEKTIHFYKEYWIARTKIETLLNGRISDGM